MRIAGLPLWAFILIACATVPFLVQVWADAEDRRRARRTLATLASIDPAIPARIAARTRKRKRERAGLLDDDAQAGPKNAVTAGDADDADRDARIQGHDVEPHDHL